MPAPALPNFLVAGAGLLAVGAALVASAAFSPPRPRVAEEPRAERQGDGDGPAPYPRDALPGGRDVDTPYGRLRVYEWGEEGGEKVLLLHGIGTPSLALGDMATSFADKGCRVMLFDFFGRGYSDAPTDLPYDARLYVTQVLLALASSPVPWTGASSFHLVGYSLGGAVSAYFARYHPHLLRSLTLICPGGLFRPRHRTWRSRLLYSEGLLFPRWLGEGLVARRLRPRMRDAVDAPPVEEEEGTRVEFDEVWLDRGRGVRVGDVVAWQLGRHPGFVHCYRSTIRHAPIYPDADRVWNRLGELLAERRVGGLRPRGLDSGRVLMILAEHDEIVVKEEWEEDARVVLGDKGVEFVIVEGGHEIAISKGFDLAEKVWLSWRK